MAASARATRTISYKEALARQLKSPLGRMAFLSLGGIDAIPVRLPAALDEKNDWKRGEKGKLHEQRVFFLISELSKDAAFISTLSPQSQMQWTMANAAADALTTEIVNAGISLPSSSGSSNSVDQIVNAYRTGLEAINKTGRAIDSVAERTGGATPSSKQLLGALKSEMGPDLEEGAAAVSELLSSVAAPIMDSVSSIAGTIGPLLGPAGMVFSLGVAVFNYFEGKRQEEIARYRQEESRRARDASDRLSAIAQDLESQCRDYSRRTMPESRGGQVFPSDYFRTTEMMQLFGGYLGMPSDKQADIPDLGRAFMAVAVPSPLALETIRFINLWSAARYISEKTWAANSPLKIGKVPDKAFLAEWRKKNPRAADFATALSFWRDRSEPLHLGKEQMRRNYLASLELRPNPDAENRFERDESKRLAAVNRKAKITDWMLSAPTLHTQPVLASETAVASLRGTKINDPTAMTWANAPWSPARIAKKIAARQVFPNLTLYGTLGQTTGKSPNKSNFQHFTFPGVAPGLSGDLPGRGKTNFAVVKFQKEPPQFGQSSITCKGGACLVDSYNAMNGPIAQKAADDLSAILRNFGFPILALRAPAGLPTRWDAVEDDSWMQRLRANNKPIETVDDTPGSINAGKVYRNYWPESNYPFIPDPKKFEEQAEYLVGPIPPYKEDGSPLLTYGVSPRTRSLFELMIRLILEESADGEALGAKIMPYFVDLLLYEMNNGRITDESIAAILATEFPCWDVNKGPRNQLYAFLREWQARKFPRSGEELARKKASDESADNLRQATATLISNPNGLPKFLEGAFGGGIGTRSDVKQLAQTWSKLQSERSKKLPEIAERVGKAAADRQRLQREGASAQEIEASQKALLGKLAKDSSALTWSAWKDSSSSGKAASGSGSGLALGLIAAATIGGGAYYLVKKKKGK